MCLNDAAAPGTIALMKVTIFMRDAVLEALYFEELCYLFILT